MLGYKEKYGEIIYEYNYEELVKDPNSEIPKIINWLGWKWDDAYLSPHKNKRSVFTASNYQVRQKIYSSSIGIWKYPDVRSNTVKYFGFFFDNLSNTCFMLGNGHPLECVALFNARKSTQNL